MSYTSFFERVTGHSPFPYQEQLASGDWPVLVDVPTGLGKTAAVVGAWLWRRLQGDAATGCRLVYCLPMRVLVEQTAAVARALCDKAAGAFRDAGKTAPTVHVLMGGEVDARWESHPEQPAIIVGTQDMLLSRALNRGYAMFRTRWPIHFALLANDCTWVLDETQLMGVGVRTSAQLRGLSQKLGVAASANTVWMSATVCAAEIDTIDHPEPAGGWPRLGLSTRDRNDARVLARIRAPKQVTRESAPALSKETDAAVTRHIAQRALEAHARVGGLTLIVVNRVVRAQALYVAIRESAPEAHVALIHSRFRVLDRQTHEVSLGGPPDEARIVVATQAVEAGVDISARTLFTDLAPWPSLVQRFGRCNRYGAPEGGAISWVDIDTWTPKDTSHLPYPPDELDRARQLLSELTDASPETLAAVPYEPPAVVRPVLRKRDLLDLFDTTPDLTGTDIDVSRFVRDGDDTDVQFAWRSFDGREPLPDTPAREELCSVGIGAANSFLSDLDKTRRKRVESGEKGWHLRAWQWDPLSETWVVVTRARPGATLVLHADAGGYDPAVGWTGVVARSPVPPVETRVPSPQEGLDADRETGIGRWVALRHHLGLVENEARALCAAVTLPIDDAGPVITAARWHDVGKAHSEFQRRLTEPVEDIPALCAPAVGVLWAKSSHQRRLVPPGRPFFRHELASALAWLASAPESDSRDLVAYLVAAHHGKVRMSLRSIPGERVPGDDRPFARGVWDGDNLPAVRFADDEQTGPLSLDLSLVRLGQGSWLERTVHLRDTLGPFRLAFLETLVRVADWRGSRKGQQGGGDE